MKCFPSDVGFWIVERDGEWGGYIAEAGGGGAGGATATVGGRGGGAGFDLSPERTPTNEVPSMHLQYGNSPSTLLFTIKRFPIFLIR